MKKLFCLGLLFFAVPALSQECEVENPQSKTITWTAPTGFTDGKPFGFDAEHPLLDGYYIYLAKNPIVTTGDAGLVKIDIEHSTLTTWILECLEPRTRYFVRMTSYVPSGSDKAESAFSGEINFTTSGPPIVPNPPENLQISEENLTAYTLVQTKDRIALLPVGTAVPGTPCDGEQNVKGLYVIPRDSVQWAGSVRPQVVVAQCEPTS